MRRRFFVERFENGVAVLRGAAAHHLGRVLRAERGHLYELSDGETLWLARTERVGGDAIEFALVERVPASIPALRITLLLSIVKFDSFEWALEKATELGADQIVPLAAERSDKGLIAASAKRAARWEKILLESAQQSRRLRVPELRGTAKPRQSFQTVQETLRLLLSERAGASPMREVIEPSVPLVGGAEHLGVALAIGPEGGWTDAEFASALGAGFSQVALGTNILRTETAVCAALAAIQYAFGASQPPAKRHGSQKGANSEAP